MLGFVYDRNTPVPASELYRFCRDEDLNYEYTVAGIQKKSRKKGKALRFFKRMRAHRLRQTRFAEPGCPCALTVKTE